MIEKLKDKFTKYEIARILGARSLQLAMDAPVLLKLSKEEMEELNFDSLKTAEKELISGVLPITVRRPLPKKSEKTVRKLTPEEIKARLEEEALKQAKVEKVEEVKEEKVDKEVEEGEVKEEKEVAQEGEIMEMASPEDEENVVEEDAAEGE
jgi:DNA-directed RNA polymerase subunit K